MAAVGGFRRGRSGRRVSTVVLPGLLYVANDVTLYVRLRTCFGHHFNRCYMGHTCLRWVSTAVNLQLKTRVGCGEVFGRVNTQILTLAPSRTRA